MIHSFKLYSLTVVLGSWLAFTTTATVIEEGLEDRDLKSSIWRGLRPAGAGPKCVDSSWLHNQQNNIIEVPSRFQKIRSCRKADTFIMNLAGNKNYKYGYNLNNEVDTRVLASYQTKARCPVEILPPASLPRTFCPTRKPNGPWISLANFLLCDGVKNCPNGEDEDSAFCNYYKSMLRDLQRNFIQMALLGDST